MDEKDREIQELRRQVESIREAVKQRPHGQWELHEDDCWSGGGFTKCSACGYGFAWGAFFEAEEWEFCPICGASMDLKGEPHEQN